MSSAGPDGTSAWVVAFAVCMINLIMAGLGRMSGILYVAFIELFGVDRKTASTPFSIRSSTGNLLGPIVGILGQRYGVRRVAVLGGILSTISAASCFFAHDMYLITILWGIFNGIGSSLVVTLPQVTIGQYFKKYHSTASGMAFSGGCFGSLIFPGVLDLLLYHYGLSGTFLFIAAIIMHTIPAAMILKKPDWLKSKTNKTSEISTISNFLPFKEHRSPRPNEKENKDPEKLHEKLGRRISKIPVILSTPSKLLPKEHKSPIPKEKAVKKISGSKGKDGEKWHQKLGRRLSNINAPDIEYLQKNRHLVVKMLTLCAPLDVDLDKFKLSLSEEMEDIFLNPESHYRKNLVNHKDTFIISSPVKAGPQTRDYLAVSSPKLTRNRSMPDLTKISLSLSHDSILNMIKELLKLNTIQVTSRFPGEDKKQILKVLKELKKFHDSRTQITHKPVYQTPPKSKEPQVHQPQKNTSIKSLLMTALRLHTRPIFVLICLCRVVHFVAFIPVLTTVVDFVIDKGMKEEDGKWAIASLSIGDLLGRLCFGWVTDKGFLSLPRFMLTVMVAQGLSTLSLPLMDSKLTLFFMLGVFGMLQGSLLIRHPILVLRYTRSNEQAIAMGCTNFFSGLLGLALPLYIGYFRDTLGSYDYIFYINGMIGALVGLMWTFEPFLVKISTPTLITEKGQVV